MFYIYTLFAEKIDYYNNCNIICFHLNLFINLIKNFNNLNT